MRRGTSAAAVAGLTAFLVLAGAAAAVAAWSASAAVPVHAGAAQTGLTQTGDFAPLAVTYTPGTGALSAAAPVTVTNTGTRAARYTLTVTPHDATAATLPGKIAVAIGSVGTVAACTTSATLANPQTGTLAAAFAYDSVTPGLTLAAGASIVLCARTSIAQADAEAHGATSLQLDLRSALRYADGSAWTTAGETRTVAQSVASTLLFFTNAAGRYLIDVRNASGVAECVYRYTGNGNGNGNGNGGGGGSGNPIAGPGCGAWQNQWRLTTGAAANQWTISEAVNSVAQPTDPRWQAGATGTLISTTAPSTATSQQWQIQGRGDGTYRIVSVLNGLCAQWSSPKVSGAADGSHSLILAACDNALSTQSFTFTVIGTPVPPTPYALSCTGNQWFMDVSWPVNTGYQAESVYRVLVNGAQVATVTNGYYTHWQFSLSDAWVQASTPGQKTVTVQQSVSGSAELTYATGTITLTRQSSGQIWPSCS